MKEFGGSVRMGKFLRSILIGFIVGVILFFGLEQFHIINSTWLTFLFAGLTFCMVIFCYLLYQKRQLRRHLGELTKNLLDTQNLNQYMEGCLALLQRTKRKRLRQIVKINYAVGYSLFGEYEKAIEVLEKIDNSQLSMPLQMLKYQNIAYNYFQSGEISRGCAIVERFQQELEICLQSNYGASNIALTFALWAFVMGKGEQGFAFLVQSIQSGVLPWEIQNAKVIWAKECLLRDRKTEATEILEELMEEKTMPNVSKQAKRLYHFAKQDEL